MLDFWRCSMVLKNLGFPKCFEAFDMECQQGSLPQVGVTWWNFTYIKVTSWQSCGHFVMISRCFHYFQSCKAPQNNRVKKRLLIISVFNLQSLKGQQANSTPRPPNFWAGSFHIWDFQVRQFQSPFGVPTSPVKKGWGLSCKVLKWLLHRLSKPLWREAFQTNKLLFFPAPPKKSPWLQKSKVVTVPSKTTKKMRLRTPIPQF